MPQKSPRVFRDQWEIFQSERAHQWRAATRETNISIMNKWVLPVWGERRIDTLEVAEISRWLAIMSKKHSRSLVHKAYLYLRAVCAAAADRGDIPRNPLQRLKAPSHSVSRPVKRRALTPAAARQIEAHLPKLKDQCIFALLLHCGLRPGELAALRWEDWDGASLLIVDESRQHNGTVSSPKTQSSHRAVAVPVRVQSLLAMYRPLLAMHKDFIFTSKQRGPLNPDSWLKKVLYPTCDKLGMERVRLQNLRTTFATWAAKAGVPTKPVMSQLGHTSSKMTEQVYTLVGDPTLLDLVERVARVRDEKDSAA